MKEPELTTEEWVKLFYRDLSPRDSVTSVRELVWSIIDRAQAQSYEKGWQDAIAFAEKAYTALSEKEQK